MELITAPPIICLDNHVGVLHDLQRKALSQVQEVTHTTKQAESSCFICTHRTEIIYSGIKPLCRACYYRLSYRLPTDDAFLSMYPRALARARDNTMKSFIFASFSKLITFHDNRHDMHTSAYTCDICGLRPDACYNTWAYHDNNRGYLCKDCISSINKYIADIIPWLMHVCRIVPMIHPACIHDDVKAIIYNVKFDHVTGFTD